MVALRGTDDSLHQRELAMQTKWSEITSFLIMNMCQILPDRKENDENHTMQYCLYSWRMLRPNRIRLIAAPLIFSNRMSLQTSLTPFANQEYVRAPKNFSFSFGKFHKLMICRVQAHMQGTDGLSWQALQSKGVGLRQDCIE